MLSRGNLGGFAGDRGIMTIVRKALRLRLALSEEGLLPEALGSLLFPRGLCLKLFLDPETEVRVGDSRNAFNPKNDPEVLQVLDRLLDALVVQHSRTLIAWAA